MPEPRLVSVVGKKNSGKTTLVVALVRELVRRGHRVMTIKHGAHAFEMDQKGRDTWRHMHEGGAERVVMETPGSRILIAKTDAEAGPRELATVPRRRALRGGSSRGSRSPTFRRSRCSGAPCTPRRCTIPAAPEASQYIALVTDAMDFRASIPVLRFNDTNWLYRLVDLVSQGAR